MYNQIIHRNLKNMQVLADRMACDLYPHFKTHKSLWIAREQMKCGASGITCATLEEAEVLASGGIKDIILAYPVIDTKKMHRLLNISQYSNVDIVIESLSALKRLAGFLRARGNPGIGFYVEIDTGLGRLGLHPEGAARIILKMMKIKDGLSFRGILSHAGHAYSSSGKEEVVSIAADEVAEMINVKEQLSDYGFDDVQISVGCTPTILSGQDLSGVSNIRPGNYVFNDAIQVGLGVCGPQDCALRVISEVISVKKDRLIIDAGSKSLGLDKGAHSNEICKGHGIIVRKPGSSESIEGLFIERLSEEHGIIRRRGASGIKEGDIIEIIPNHSCYVTNLFSNIYVIDQNSLEVLHTVDVDARR
ncbi:MAG: alanine racemase [Candidatus Muiribacteriaceae bacterium]